MEIPQPPPQDVSFFEKARNWVSNSITLRLFTIGILILIMLIPVSMIENLIRERQYRQSDAQNEISEIWGHPQTLTGPVLTVPYTVYNKVYDKDEASKYKMVATTQYLHFLPENLKIDGSIVPEVRYRGIFETIVYGTEMEISGNFVAPNVSEWEMKENFRWNEAFVSIGISDLRSIQEDVKILWTGESKSFEPGVPCYDVFSTGIHSKVNVEPFLPDNKLEYAFKMNFKFNGSNYIKFTPVGKTTDVFLNSPWQTPSFDGAFLPDKREINKNGFTAHWNVLNLNRSYPQYFIGTTSGINESAFGVSLMLPIDQYQKSMRAAKYAVLFISLTFMVFFFMQIINKVRIHPIQYILVGLALCIFYTLLISLSEQMHFGFAYLIAASAIVLLTTFYAQGTFKNMKLSIMLAAIMGILYGFIYSIIQLEDYALLVGSIGLFIALAVLMYVTRKIEWYSNK